MSRLLNIIDVGLPQLIIQRTQEGLNSVITKISYRKIDDTNVEKESSTANENIDGAMKSTENNLMKLITRILFRIITSYAVTRYSNT